jgi:predicted amidohydrolase
MRILLGQLAPVPGDVDANVGRIDSALSGSRVDLAVFPELFLTGYRLGDRFHGLALTSQDPVFRRLSEIARNRRCAVVLGAPMVSLERPGELGNVALLFRPDGSHAVQVKRYLPTYGPFEEGTIFTPTHRSDPVDLSGALVGLEICYDAFFPEVSRELALRGAVLLVTISASPVTSRRLFEKVLPARAVENATPLVYVNRVGVEDGLVFGGGSMALDARGEPVRPDPQPLVGTPEESLATVELDLSDVPRWRPFRPVLRDVASRPPS